MFIPRENFDGYFQIVNTDEFAIRGGSYNVIQARLLGFTYPDYLRYCRAKHKGTLRGRTGYSYVVFKDKKDCLDVCKLLNNEWKKVKEYFVKEV